MVISRRPESPRPVASTAQLVLVVDDDPRIRQLLDTALRADGYEVLTASHGASALEVVRKHVPAAIILDIWMPIMDGWDFLRAYTEFPGPHSPVIALTASRDSAARALQLGCCSFLAKPFSVETLVSLVRRHAATPQRLRPLPMPAHGYGYRLSRRPTFEPAETTTTQTPPSLARAAR